MSGLFKESVSWEQKEKRGGENVLEHKRYNKQMQFESRWDLVQKRKL